MHPELDRSSPPGEGRGETWRICLVCLVIALTCAVVFPRAGTAGEDPDAPRFGLPFPSDSQDRDAIRVTAKSQGGTLRGGPIPSAEPSTPRKYFPETRGHDRFGTNPVSNPFYFETPFIETSARPLFFYQELPETSPIGGGRAVYVGVQGRIAITDRFALLLTKNGSLDTDLPQGGDETGGTDIAVGFKLILLRSEDFILTGGTRFEFPSGSRRVLQGNGSGEWSPFVSAGFFFDRLSFLSNVSWRIPVDDDEESTQILVSGHVGYELFPFLHPFGEITVQSVIEDGKRQGLRGVEGFDLWNLGSDGTGGNDVATVAAGVRVLLSDRLSLGFAAEFPLTQRSDFMKKRFLLDLEWMF